MSLYVTSVKVKKVTDQQELHVAEDEKTVTDTDVPLNVPSDRESDLRNKLWKHDHMWTGN